MIKPLRIILLTVGSYFIIKLYFLFWHYGLFSELLKGLSGNEKFTLLYQSIRLDISAICLLQIPVFLCWLASQFLRNRTMAGSIFFFATMIFYLPSLLVNIADIGYYSFHQRRMNYDVFYVLGDSVSDLSSWLIRYWHLFVFFALITTVYVWMARRIIFQQENSGKQPWRTTFFTFILILIGVRGISARPILPSTPLLYLPSSLQPLASNSTLSLLYSVAKKERSLEDKALFPQSLSDSVFPVRQELVNEAPFQKKNIVIFVLESFSPDYLTDSSPLRAETPFLDSLQGKSIRFTNAHANGIQSNEGLPAMLLSVPPFSDVPYFHSIYANNALRPIGTVLAEKGYQSYFFLGAGKDHFGFEKLSKLAGIKQYISGDDYGNSGDHDGHWGISDHYFLPFAAEYLKKQRSPFMAVVYNLSTHPPFYVPDRVEGFQSTNKKGSPQRSAAYTDYALRLFFNQIRDQPWYTNTVFVFMADHTIQSILSDQVDELNTYTIPFFIHEPVFVAQKNVDYPVQQLDLVPGLLDYLSYSGKFTAFGKSFRKPQDSHVIREYHGNLQIVSDSLVLGYNEELDSVMYVYPYTHRKLSPLNLTADPAVLNKATGMKRNLQLFRQQYNYTLINNRMKPE